ncbi:oligopeptide transport system permease protein [Clostridium cavendishii DSM 21758]|uniref:Oligopeptide transport system permease protein n=1 Tax=Clostridium cavendishii DSM 21758 TaxID=1121302 RepID=A0A1M6IBS9_9CLOT|nr:ABC transporter permease [Clostridium cavendishii]SHJ31880.1 oligopeptide transport system permease protein [Clostridium cavendishii DSM 21758]
MTKYILKRIVVSLITIWMVVTITFFLMRLLPGGPFSGEKKLPPSVQMNLEAKFGMNKPLGEQYTTYLKSVASGYLGPSMYYDGRSVNEIIATHFPTSAKLGVVSILFSLIIGIAMGIIAAIKQDKWQDRATMIISTIGVTVPSFVLATILMYIFAVKLNLVPALGLNGASSYILPTIALSGYNMAFIARLSRSSLVEVIRQDYIRVARAKGMSGKTVIVKHALRNSLIPVVTYTGPIVAMVLTGSFVIESIFGIPGIGKEFVTSIGSRDYTLTLGLTVFFSSFLVVCNLIVDILYGIIDPRIKVS